MKTVLEAMLILAVDGISLVPCYNGYTYEGDTGGKVVVSQRVGMYLQAYGLACRNSVTTALEATEKGRAAMKEYFPVEVA